MLSGKQREEFEASGVLKIEQLISKEAVSGARKGVLSRFETLNYASNGNWCLDERPRSIWPDKGYSAKKIGNKIKEVELLLDQP